MSALVPIHFRNADVRMIMRAGEPWWVGDDIAAILDLTNRRDAVGRLEDYERDICTVDTPGGPQAATIINESGVYSLLLTSRKPVAKAMKRWLTTEVLPSIRKYGQYPPPALESDCEPRATPVTQAGRLLQEIERWQARNEGQDIHAANVISRNKLKSLVLMRAFSGAHLTKDGLWLKLANQGIDIFYILHGRPWVEAYPAPVTQRALRIASAD